MFHKKLEKCLLLIAVYCLAVGSCMGIPFVGKASATNATLYNQDGIGFSGAITSNPISTEVEMTGYNNWPTELTKGNFGFSGGVFDGQSIWMIPYQANGVLKIDKDTAAMTVLNNWPTGFVKTNSVAFSAGVYDGQSVWMIPYSADRVIQIDKNTGAMTGYGDWPAGTTSIGATAFTGGVYDGRNIWLVPLAVNKVIKLDTMTGTMTGYNDWPSGFDASSGGGFGGGVYDGQYIWLIPNGAKQLVKLDPATGTMTGYSDWPVGFDKSKNSFSGGILDGHNLWMFPSSVTGTGEVVKFDITTETMTAYNQWPSGYTRTYKTFFGGSFDGQSIWMAPGNNPSDSVIRIDKDTGEMTALNSWPAGFTRGGNPFRGGVYDGRNVWLVPFSADRIIKISSKTYTIAYTAGANGSITGSATQTVDSGKSGTSVTAVASSGYHFVSWSDGKTDATRTDTNITDNLNVTATFEADALTYSIASIQDQTYLPLLQGYAADSQGTKQIDIANTGTGNLTNLAVSLGGIHANDFVVTSPLMPTLHAGASSSFAMKAKNGLAAGAYTATVTISADNMTDVTFTLTQAVNAPNVPAQPQNLVAHAGDRQVALNWSTVAGATYYNIYMATVSGQADSAEAMTVTGITYNIQHLMNGTTYYFVVKAGNSEGLSIASNQVGATPESGNSSDGSKYSSTSEATNNGVDILVNGKAENVGIATTTRRNNQTVITVAIDQKNLEDKLAAAGRGAVVTIPVNTSSDVVIGELNGQMLKNMENKQAILEIKTNKAAYTLPAQQMNMNAISDRIGKSVPLQDIKVHIEIALPTADRLKVVESAAEKGTFALVASPIDFTVRGIYGDTTVEVTKFSAYVERTVALPDDVDPAKITTGVVVDPDGSVRHVPTKVVLIDGKHYAIMNSLTNSTYSVVWHPLQFSDVANHWAKEAVNDMGSRMVIDGAENGMFNPDLDITRAEFAAIIVRGLGLRLENGASNFSDVTEKDWYSSVINTAYAYHLIHGFEDGTFRPNDKITREQAMVMISQAMVVTNLKAKLAVQTTETILGSYTDAAEASGWAQSSIADSVQSGIVTGRSGTVLAPKANITRAEVAMIVERLLRKSALI